MEEENLFADFIESALKVEFLKSKEELFLYAKALYEATMWGRRVDRENEIIQERNDSK